MASPNPTNIQHPIENDFNQCNYESVDDVTFEQIEKYQLLHQRDPQSRVFAPLAECYRRKSMIKEGLEVASEGVKLHPDFAGGRVALARLYLDSQQFDLAEKEFRKATELAPENLLAYQLLGEVYLRLKKPKEALKTYKILLFLSPENEKAKNAIKKLEALTADEYEEDLFAMKPLKDAVKNWDDLRLDLEFNPQDPNENTKAKGTKPKAATPAMDAADNELKRKNSFLDRVLSLVDAYLVRQDVDRAIGALNEGERLLGPHPEIVKRLKMIHQRQLDQMTYPKSSADIAAQTKSAQTSTTPQKRPLDLKIQYLQDLLQRIKKSRDADI